MQAESKFLKQSLEFWANVKLISQKIGYTERKTSAIKVPTIDEIEKAFDDLGLDSSRIISNKKATAFGILLIEYFQHRANFLTNHVEPNLQDKNKAKKLYAKLKKELKPTCPQPMNKQKGAKQAPAFFTCIINMLIEANAKGYDCNYDPKELTAFTQNSFPVRSLSRRVDGSFPNVINPIAIWEIKEYYYTTTFGSRVADGVYETLLDGYELNEVRGHLNKRISHYLMIDDYNTWWTMGRSYLCRICDMLHMGLLTEAIFGKEAVDRVPQLVKEWTEQLDNK
jgi:hypothetical protein